jgi:hypothetical protein
MKRVLVPALTAVACGLVLAKLPPPDPAAKAKTDETAAKTAWQGKVDAYQLCKVQDKIAAAYGHGSAKGKAAAASAAAASSPAKGPSADAMATQAGAAVAKAQKPPASAAAPAASSGATTPVASAPPAACADPGPFAYNAPEQKPLETSGAHSPAGNATSPPSVNQESAKMAPAKKS